MTKIFPKYHELICDTYTPDFDASGTPCTLQTAEEVTKSRLEIGGTFFRSVRDGGTGNVNKIELECVVTPRGDGTDDVVLIVYDIGGAEPVSIPFTQTYGSPCPVDGNGITNLRDILNAGSPTYPYPVMMPEIDDPASWNSSTDDADCIITAFSPPIEMGGAIVLPDASVDIRTGPAFTLFHIQKAETGNTGAVTEIDALSEWDGTQWIPYPSELFDPDSPPPCP